MEKSIMHKNYFYVCLKNCIIEIENEIRDLLKRPTHTHARVNREINNK